MQVRNRSDQRKMGQRDTGKKYRQTRETDRAEGRNRNKDNSENHDR